MVVSPEEFTNSRQDKKSKIRVLYEENIAEERKVGKPCTGVPLPEEVQKDREAALQATMDITGGKASSPTEPKDDLSFKKAEKKSKESKPVNKAPHGEKAQTPVPPGYHQARDWYCENCNMVHSGPLCPCPICRQKGHLYYHCPDRDKKESVEGAYQQMQISGQGPECEMCGQKHEPPCTIGLKQQGLIQKQMQYNKDGDKYEPSRGENLQTRTTTPYCMYCGEKGGQHTPKCELLGSTEFNEEPLCTFCGIIGHWADNCAERQRVF